MYTCEKCNYVTKRKSDYIKHCITKKHINNLKDVKKKNIDEIKEEENLDKRKKENDNFNIYDNNSLRCPFCSKLFSSRQSKHKHIKNIVCKKKNKYNEENDKVSIDNNIEDNIFNNKDDDDILNKPKNKDIKNNNTTINNITNNTNITINNYFLTPFGSEDYSYILNDKGLMDKYLQKPYKGFRDIVKNRFYHKDHPENRNLEYPNKKDNLVRYYTDKGWKYDKLKKKQDEIIFSTKDMMHNHYLDKDTQEKIKKGIKSFDKYVLFYEDDNHDLGDEIRIILLNNRIGNKSLGYDDDNDNNIDINDLQQLDINNVKLIEKNLNSNSYKINDFK